MKSNEQGGEIWTTRAGTIELAREYPVSKRVVIMKSIVPIVIVAALAVGMLLISNESVLFGQLSNTPPSDHLNRPVELALLISVGLVGLALVCHVLYWELHRLSLYYAIEGGHFIMSRGIILKQRGSFPLARISEVYLERNFLDLIFGVYNLHISTPTAESSEFARIEGLSSRAAHGMQEYLVRLVEEVQPKKLTSELKESILAETPETVEASEIAEYARRNQQARSFPNLDSLQ